MLAGDLNVLFNHGVVLITVWCSHARYTQQTCFYRAAGYWHRISEILAAQSDNTSSSPYCRSVSLPVGSLCGDPEVGDGGKTVSPPPAPGINIQLYILWIIKVHQTHLMSGLSLYIPY